MPLIHECVLTTLSPQGRPHVAPLGLIEEGSHWIAAPFRPSTTLFNLEHSPKLTASFTDDARIFAGLVTGTRSFPLTDVEGWPAPRLSCALAHAELEVVSVEEDATRPRFVCSVLRTEAHRPFMGMNRARAAVLEAAILATRLDRLTREKIDSEIAYLTIAIDKTAGEAEREAWDMVMAKIAAHLDKA
ncbi:MAG: tetrahydromethanopterin synthesis protein [Methylocystis sp.]|nr:MAG: tetrahydromethanopterin synthesis protein [Methylocystis sp.]